MTTSPAFYFFIYTSREGFTEHLPLTDMYRLYMAQCVLSLIPHAYVIQPAISSA